MCLVRSSPNFFAIYRSYSHLAMQQSIMTLAMTWDYSKHLVCKQCTFCIAFGVLDLDIVYITRAAGVSKKVRKRSNVFFVISLLSNQKLM